jgi:hypothetical protein
LAFCDNQAQREITEFGEMLRSRPRVHSCDKTAQHRVSADYAVSNCLDRYNSATNASVPVAEAGRRATIRKPSNIEATGNRERLPPAEGLSMGWRFFPTYAHA